MAQDIFEQAQAAAAWIRTRSTLQPKLAIVLGTGLDALSSQFEKHFEVSYTEIPHFKQSTVEGHRGAYMEGLWDGKPVIILAGRFHYYEGYSMQEVTFPVRVLQQLGVEILLITNASGGTNENYEMGDLVLVRDHINLLPEHPLRGKNDSRLGVRFPDMTNAYDPEIRKLGLDFARSQNIRIHEGVYVSLQGPNLETPAEYDFLHRIGGDLVGMSTVPEVIVARHAGIRLAVLSVISNVCYPPDRIQETSGEDVVNVVKENTHKAIRVIQHLVQKLA